MPEKPLSSWKEIASYLGRSVRTVQRWEKELGLPVRRPSSRESSSVVAFPEQIDLWLKSIGAGMRGKTPDLPHSIAEMSESRLLGLLRNFVAEEDLVFAQFLEKRSISRRILAQLHTLSKDAD